MTPERWLEQRENAATPPFDDAAAGHERSKQFAAPMWVGVVALLVAFAAIIGVRSHASSDSLFDLGLLTSIGAAILLMPVTYWSDPRSCFRANQMVRRTISLGVIGIALLEFWLVASLVRWAF